MKNKVVKRILSAVLAAALVVSLAACGSSGKTEDTKTDSTSNNTPDTENGSTEPSTDEKITLNVWHQWSNDTNELKKLYDAAAGEYMEQNPNIIINTQTLDTEAYKTKISAEFTGTASGIDVFYYWGAGTAKKLVNADKLLPLDDYITDEIKAKLLPGSTGAFIYDGKTYSLPSFSWYMTLFCNQELFDQAGAALPTTYDEMLAASQKLSQLEGVTPIAAGAKDGWNAAFVYQALAMREVGAENVNKMLKGEIPFGEDSGYKTAAEKVLELYKAGAFGKNPLESGNDDANSAFITGKAAMRIMGSWFANQVYTDDTATVNPEKVVALKIPMITGKGNESDYCGGFIESFWVNKNTKYADEAAKFAIYINEQMGKAAYETGTGFCGWNVDLDESKLNPLFVQIKDLAGAGQTSVLAWDTSLDANPATIHNEQVQTLFAPDADVDAFIGEHEAAINQ
ncbi:MAG TPA: extracellular solute-binding protein [Clostridiales bacterium]|nr:extracellular solute-binding protein [Clostridiales bacterium]